MLTFGVSILTPEIEYHGVRTLDLPDPPAGGWDALPQAIIIQKIEEMWFRQKKKEAHGFLRNSGRSAGTRTLYPPD